jgi:hypothetical protein
MKMTVIWISNVMVIKGVALLKERKYCAHTLTTS